MKLLIWGFSVQITSSSNHKNGEGQRVTFVSVGKRVDKIPTTCCQDETSQRRSERARVLRETAAPAMIAKPPCSRYLRVSSHRTNNIMSTEHTMIKLNSNYQTCIAPYYLVQYSTWQVSNCFDMRSRTTRLYLQQTAYQYQPFRESGVQISNSTRHENKHVTPSSGKAYEGCICAL